MKKIFAAILLSSFAYYAYGDERKANVYGNIHYRKTKIVSTNDYSPYFCENMSSIDSHGYLLAKKERAYYLYDLNINKQIGGPYDEVSRCYDYRNTIDSFHFTYYKSGRQYLSRNGATLLGPFYQIFNCRIDTRGRATAVVVKTKEDEGKYLYYNDRLYGPFEQIGSNIATNEAGDITASVIKEQNNYLMTNDTLHGPFDQIEGISHINDRGSFITKVRKSDGWYLQMNDRLYGPHETIYFLTRYNSSFDYLVNEIGGFLYYVAKSNNKYSLYKNDQLCGTYDAIHYPSRIDRNGNVYTIAYRDRDIYWLKNGSVLYGPFNRDQTESIHVDMSGTVYWTTGNKGTRHLVKNGVQLGEPFSWVRGFKVKDNGTVLIKEKTSENKCFLIINGTRSYGPYDDIEPYDDLNGDVYMGVKTGGQWFIFKNNEKLHGPFNTIHISIDENGTHGTVVKNGKKYLLRNKILYGPTEGYGFTKEIGNDFWHAEKVDRSSMVFKNGRRVMIIPGEFLSGDHKGNISINKYQILRTFGSGLVIINTEKTNEQLVFKRDVLAHYITGGKAIKVYTLENGTIYSYHINTR